MPPLGAETAPAAALSSSPLSPSRPPAAMSVGSASVIPSTDPDADARALVGLFPSRYALDRDDDYDDSVGVGVGSAGGGSARTGMMATVVGRREESKSDVILLVRSEVGRSLTFPSAAIVIDADDVASAVARLARTGGADGADDNAGGGAALLSRSLPSSSLSTLGCWCVVRLPGGAAVTCASPESLLSAAGRGQLAKAAVAAACGRAALDATADAFDVGLDLDSEMEDVDIGGDGLGGLGDVGTVGSIDEVPPPSYDFPSLSMKIKSDGRVVPGFRINSRVGIPVNTDLFEGKILLIMKPPDSPVDDPYWHEKVFSTKKRRFEVQIQGRFKYTPTGTVYCGAEVSEQMKLGLVSKGLCNVLLKTLTRMIPADMHFAFGDDDRDETPHIVFTAMSFFDKLVTTEDGDGPPPPMGEAFPESAKAASKRKSSSGAGEWRRGVTYSMSFNSMYLDLPTWHLRSLPMMKDIGLRTFWGDSLLNIVIYEKCGSPAESRHLTKDNRYFFSIETEFLGMPDEGGRTVKVDDKDNLPWDKKRSMTRIDSAFFASNDSGNDDAESTRSERPMSESTEDDDEESDSDETAFFDATEIEDTESEDVGLEVVRLDVPPTPERSVASRSHAERYLSPADRFCPAWVEMCVDRGKYRKVYAFIVGGGSRTTFWSASEFTGSFSTEEASKAVERTCSPRLSSSEKHRRVMGLTIAKAKDPSSKQYSRYRAFSQKQSVYDSRFLRRVAPSQLNIKVKGETVISGFAARALSEHHWKEEWVVLSDRYVSFFHPASKRPNYRVSLSGIVRCAILPPTECPNFPGCHVISIETTGRIIYLMFYSDKESTSWLEHLSNIVAAGAQSEPRETNILLDPLSCLSSYDEFLALNNDPTEEFLHKTSMFSCKERRVLNCRKLSFTGMDGSKEQNSCDAAASTLRKALEPLGDHELTNLRHFLNSAADLKAINIADFSGAERMAFFLNLYHIMVTHAYLVLGVPDSSFKWVSYFNMISYQCSDEIFSLTELEHCIIRAQMSSPSQFVAKFVLPKSRYQFSLPQSLVDWRLNFCLNCGSLSNPRSVPIFKAGTLLSQINECTRLFLKETVKVVVDSKKGCVSVTLPKICQWFAGDFGRGRSTDIVRLLMKYFSPQEQHILSKSLAPDGRHFKTGALNVTFSSFDYTCRLLTLRGE